MTTSAAVQSWSEEEVARLRAGPDSPDTVGSTDDTGASGSIPADDLFHLLQNSRRRAVLRYLRGRERPVQMREVAEQVAAWENDTTVAQLTSDERQRVYIALYQSHLETLEDAGVIEYNKPRGVIEPLPLLDSVASYVDMDPPEPTDAGEDGDGDAWAGRYLSASVVSGLLLVGAAFGLLSSFTAGVLILTFLTGMAMAWFLLDRDEAV